VKPAESSTGVAVVAGIMNRGLLGAMGATLVPTDRSERASSTKSSVGDSDGITTRAGRATSREEVLAAVPRDSLMSFGMTNDVAIIVSFGLTSSRGLTGGMDITLVERSSPEGSFLSILLVWNVAS
jgi:hypothetical protein